MRWLISLRHAEKSIVEKVGEKELFLRDHLGGIDKNFRNTILARVAPRVKVRTEYIVDHRIRQNYPRIDIIFDAARMIRNNGLQSFVYRSQPKDADIENFCCSFFRTYYPGRVNLLCWLHELGWFNPDYGSKNFVIDQYPEEIKRLYAKYIGDDFDDESKQIRRLEMQKSLVYLGGQESRYQHDVNLISLRSQIQKSFVCIVAETDPAHYYPFPTEKFLYPIINSTLWVAYAQPGYHKMLKEKLGFKLHDCFDYSFDQIEDHDERIYELTQALKKFSTMTQSEWQEVYRTQQHILDYNAQYVNSGEFINTILSLDEVDQ